MRNFLLSAPAPPPRNRAPNRPPRNGELDLDEFFLLAFPEFHPDHDKSAEFMAHDMYLKCSPDAKGDISLQGMVKAYVGTQLAGKDCKTEECSTAEQSRSVTE
jgi:hypothetical protein